MDFFVENYELFLFDWLCLVIHYFQVASPDCSDFYREVLVDFSHSG
jgi:hypothetical protein